MELLQFMEFILVGVTLLLFISGLPACISMYKNNSTDNVPFNIFLLSLIASLGNFHYGVLQNNFTVIFLNLIGGILFFIYSLLYLYVCKSMLIPFFLCLTAIVYEVVLYGYLSTFNNQSEFANNLGGITSILTTILMVLPCFELIDNIRNKNSNGVPLLMLIGGLLCSSSWFIYGYMLNDPIIYMPNIPGLIVTGFKLAMHIVYPQRQKRD